MESPWSLHGVSMESLWSLYGVSMESLWSLYGVSTVSLTCPSQTTEETSAVTGTGIHSLSPMT